MPGPKSGPEKGPESGPKTGAPLGSPGAQKHKEFKGFWSFLASQRDTFLDTFLDPGFRGIFWILSILLPEMIPKPDGSPSGRARRSYGGGASHQSRTGPPDSMVTPALDSGALEMVPKKDPSGKPNAFKSI